MSTPAQIRRLVQFADLTVGAVLIPGAKAPRLISREMLKTMRPGSVLVDVSVDQGGCFETTKATTHDDPIYVVDGVVHYCVANMPGAVPKTSTVALTNATLPYVSVLAVFVFVAAGLYYILSFTDEELHNKAKTMMTYVVIGIVIIFSAYTVVNTLLSFSQLE